MNVNFTSDGGQGSYLHLKQDEAGSVCIVGAAFVKQLMSNFGTVYDDDRTSEDIQIENIRI